MRGRSLSRGSTATSAVKIIVLGDQAVGKTCLLASFTTNSFPDQYVPTEFENHHTNLMVNGREIELDLVDTSGQHDNKLRSLSFEKADIFMLLFAMGERDSFENCKIRWLAEIQESNKKRIDGTQIPFILVGTKSDIQNKKTQISPKDIDKFVSDTPICMDHKQTSALTKVGVNEAFECAVR
eukprot:411949_1